MIAVYPNILIGTTPPFDDHPISTSRSMASILARQFCQLQSAPVTIPATTVHLAILDAPVAAPLRADVWEVALAEHPGSTWANYLVQGMRQGFRIGLKGDVHCRSVTSNAPSAHRQSTQVTKFISQQLTCGYMLGPLDPQQASGVVRSRLAATPKKTPNHWHTIVNLSSPEKASVNDNLKKELTHVAYSSVEDAVLLLHRLGQGALMAKINIKDAYCIIPINPNDRCYLGIERQGKVFVDKQLPLASAPAIFSPLSKTLEWVLQHSDNVAAVAQANTLHGRSPPNSSSPPLSALLPGTDRL